jgi:hypothetical protein
MPDQTREVRPSKTERAVLTEDGATLQVPPDWTLLPPGDAALSRRVKKEGPCWVVKEKRGRKMFSRGIWAPTERIERIKQTLNAERQDPNYERKLEAGRARRAKEQTIYVEEFEAAVLGFLRFAEPHQKLARLLARAITAHAVPVGSGTVARTQRIPIERRAEAATIAWMRHQTTAYDDMSIPRVKGMRREVRRMLAERSRGLLRTYRDEGATPPVDCPLRRALQASPISQ